MSHNLSFYVCSQGCSSYKNIVSIDELWLPRKAQTLTVALIDMACICSFSGTFAYSCQASDEVHPYMISFPHKTVSSSSCLSLFLQISPHIVAFIIITKLLYSSTQVNMLKTVVRGKKCWNVTQSRFRDPKTRISPQPWFMDRSEVTKCNDNSPCTI